MRTKKTKGQQTIADIQKQIEDPMSGIREPSKSAIMALFKKVFMDEPMNPETERRWTLLGRFDDGKIVFDFEHIRVDLSVMSLQWDGWIERIQVPVV